MQKADADGTLTVPVPDHRELRIGTLMSIIRQSGLPVRNSRWVPDRSRMAVEASAKRKSTRPIPFGGRRSSILGDPRARRCAETALDQAFPGRSAWRWARSRGLEPSTVKFFGRDRRPETLSQRDWDRFIRERRAGAVGPSGKPVGNRMIEWDLTFLMAVLNWAARSRDEQGRLLLDRNPLKGLRKPVEKNPTRVVLTDEEYQALLQISRQVDWRCHVALVLAHETGHRIGAIRNLRWSDIDLECETVRWRAEHEKTGYEHRTPLTPEAIEVFEEARRRNPASGDAPVLPATMNPSAMPALPASPLLVAAGGAPRRTRAEARKGLALAETEVCQRPDGPAAQGALRTRRVEGGQDRAALLPHMLGQRRPSRGPGRSTKAGVRTPATPERRRPMLR